jgi:hypothetical protein
MTKTKFAMILLFAILAIVIVGHAYSAPVNLLANGNFESGAMDPWTTYGAMIKPEVVSSGAIEGKYCLHVVCDTKGANFWDGGLQHAGHTFDQGKIYTLVAFLKSPQKLQINFKPELAQDPWTGYGDKVMTMTESWAEYYTTTPPMPNTVNPATVTFHIAFDVGEFYIDNVQFYEGEYVPGASSAVQAKDKLATAWGQIRAK